MEIKYEVCGKLPDNTIIVALYKLNDDVISDYTFFQVDKNDEKDVNFEEKTIEITYFNKLKENYN